MRGSGKSGERERSGEREAAERRAGVTKIGLSGEREIDLTLRSHALVTLLSWTLRHEGGNRSAPAPMCTVVGTRRRPVLFSKTACT